MKVIFLQNFNFVPMRCLDFPKLDSSKVFVFIVQARYWLALFRQQIASLYNKNKHLG